MTTDDGTVPAAGNDPDTLRRIAKVHAAASRSSGGSPDGGRIAKKHDKAAERPEDEDVKEKRSAQPTKVQGRSAPSTTKA